ncbi:phosphoenolpyruvate carboxykinase (ATP), partial [uncultured Planktosalinus sp.]|uniref:phosphoenolpyruvate carboxykinase (ATP) n=1 Tax=uncultured Planktosalinus sp. TaxID=1810935 RepID=UPI0030DCABB7
TAKVAGTEAGVDEPMPNFSACFGAPFMPLHPTKYAEMLSKKMKDAGVNVWLINTGWTGGPYGIGSRMKLKYTRAMITAAMNGELATVDFEQHPIFGLAMPTHCPNVPDEVLNPKSTWKNAKAYDVQAKELAASFRENFAKFESYANEEILRGAPIG